MALICDHCASSLRQAVRTGHLKDLTRAFSSASVTRRSIPSFAETSNVELNDALQSLRSFYFNPAYLRARQRKLIYSPKYKQTLNDDPQSVFIGEAEVPLQHIDRYRDLPSRHKLVNKVLDIIFDTQREWTVIPELLRGLNEGLKRPAHSRLQQKIVFKAQEADKVGIVLHCLQQGDKTGMTLRDREVLLTILHGLRRGVLEKKWSQASVEKALKNMNSVTKLLEHEVHGGGSWKGRDDPRGRPEILAHFLELAAVDVLRYQGKQDSQNVVSTYADRLLSSLKQQTLESHEVHVADSGPQWELLNAISIWHALHISAKVLGNEMPQSQFAAKMTAAYRSVIESCIQTLQSRGPQLGQRDEVAVKAWSEALHDV